MNMKKFAVIRACAALIIALVVLICSGFSFVTLFADPLTVTDSTQLSEGSYVSADITYIMDICAVEKNDAGEAVSYYAVAPVGNAFVVIRFPADQFEDVTNLETDTINFLTGDSDTMHFHMQVEGTATEMSSTVYQYFNSWFNTNSSWMSQAGVITAVEDYTQYLCVNMIEANVVDGMSRGTAIGLNILAAVLIVYAIAEFVMVLAGVYNPKKPAKKAKKAAPKTAAAAVTAPKKAPAPAEKPAAEEDNAEPAAEAAAAPKAGVSLKKEEASADEAADGSDSDNEEV